MKDQGTFPSYKRGNVFIVQCFLPASWCQLSVQSTLTRYFTQEQIHNSPFMSLVLVSGICGVFTGRYFQTSGRLFIPAEPPNTLNFHKHLTTPRPRTRFSSHVTLVSFTNEMSSHSDSGYNRTTNKGHSTLRLTQIYAYIPSVTRQVLITEKNVSRRARDNN